MTAPTRAVLAFTAAGVLTVALAGPTANAAPDRPTAPRATAPPARAVFITGDSNNKVAAHAVGASHGLTALNDRDLGASTSPEGVAVSPDGRHVYVALFGTDQVVHVPVNTDGSLGTASAPVSTGDGPYQVAVTPNGKYVFTADYGASTISRFKVGPTGALTSLGAPTATPLTPYPMVVSPNGKFVFYGYSNLGTLSVSASGGLTPVGTPVTGVDAYGLAVSPDSKFVFAANSGSNSVTGYSVGASGQLTPVGTPVALPSGSGVNELAMTPDGKFLYAVNYSVDSITVIAVGAGGVMTEVGTPYPMPGKGPAGLVVTPDGKTAYVADYTSNQISELTIAANGTLSEAAGSPFATPVTNPDYFAITTSPNQGPVARIKKIKKGTAVAGKPVRFDAKKSKDADGKIVTYSWTFGDGKKANDGGKKPKHTYKKAGTYTVTLTVTDNEGCSDVDISTGHSLHCNATPKAVKKIKVKVGAA